MLNIFIYGFLGMRFGLNSCSKCVLNFNIYCFLPRLKLVYHHSHLFFPHLLSIPLNLYPTNWLCSFYVYRLTISASPSTFDLYGNCIDSLPKTFADSALNRCAWIRPCSKEIALAYSKICQFVFIFWL